MVFILPNRRAARAVNGESFETLAQDLFGVGFPPSRGLQEGGDFPSRGTQALAERLGVFRNP
jgi:hypothetical protein